MPYRTGYRRRMGRNQRRRRGRKGGYGLTQYVGMARKAWNLAKYVKSLVNVERKFCDIQHAPTVSFASPYLAVINPIAQGAAYNQRDGNSVKTVSIFVRGIMQIDPAAPATNVRIMILKDTEPQGPSGANVITETGVITDPMNHVYGYRFKVLSDQTYSLSQNGRETCSVYHYHKVSDHLKWADATSTSYRDMSYLILIMTEEPLLPPKIQLTSRVRFIDN